MEILPFTPRYLSAAADLFVRNFSNLRKAVPALPATLEDAALIAGKINGLLKACPGFIALENGRLVGYLTWLVANHFRNTDRRGAYCPEWAHAAATEYQSAAYRALYRAAAAQWAAQGCQVHAITLLANEQEAVQTWFWNGFGMLVVDAVRPLQPLAQTPRTSALSVRQAETADAADLEMLDAEHCRYYTESPIFMPLPKSASAEEFRQFLAQPKNSVWLALDGNQPVGFLRLDGTELDCADAVVSAQTIRINGAFVRPAFRGRGANSAMLDAALRHHADLDMTCCAVDFEAFNPDAAAFWLRHFQPVCLSMMRTPESVPGAERLSSG
jgi:GNAT superfamily N-acetyltransferase